MICTSCLRWPDAPQPPQELVRTFDQGKLDAIGVAIHEARGEKRLPGGVLWLERQDVSFHRAYGMASTRPVSTVAQGDTIYDAASLTKVVATTPAVLLLHERGKLNVQDPVRVHLPEFTGQGREAITIRHLLTHTSGLRPDISVNGWSGHQECIAKCMAELPRTAPDKRFIYSDINFQLLDEVVRRVSKKRMDVFCAEEIFGPLKMHDTGYNPPAAKRTRIAPTTVTDGKALLGVVHDPRARKTSGVAGHAGLFTTAPDLARYARMLLQAGELDGVRLFKPETVQLMTSVQTPSSLPARRGLGWDIDTSYSSPRGHKFPLGSFGHTGFTGPSLWIDPHSKTFVVFLCNRVHPTERGPSVVPLRQTIGTLAAEAVKGFNFEHVPGALPPLKRD
ncbi:MAG: serine hydrolase domain-containing protein [Limisphaerales bacterium]